MKIEKKEKINSHHKILIAEDESELVNVLESRLEYEGFSVISAQEGVRVLQKVQAEHPDLILLDLAMPAGTGQWVLQNLHKIRSKKTIPVIVLTGLQENSIKENVLSLGASDFLRKPYNPDELIRKIYQHLP